MHRRSFLRSSATAAAATTVLGGLTGPAAAMGSTGVERSVDILDEPLRLARVWITRENQHLMWGFDDTHDVFSDGSVEVLLWPGDLGRLIASGIRHEITVPDLIARDRQLAQQPLRRQVAAVQPGETATGDYRFLEDYNADMMMLAETYPEHCELLTLPFESLEGRTVYGLEIAEDVARKDGRPVFYNDGIHHAREWPAAEVPIMWAFDLLESHAAGDPRMTAIMRHTRNLIVPVVNVDGFRFSREFLTETGEQGPLGVGVIGGNGVEAASNGFGAYWRKNMRNPLGVHGTLPPNPVLTQSLLAHGVDVNRNYSYQWGDDLGGSSSMEIDGTYRGTEPYSEPESANIKHLLSTHQCIAGLSHHTSGDLILWAWGDTADDAPDDVLLARLGFAAGAYNGYQPTKKIDLYVTTGTTSDYMYGTYGTLGYTWEHAGSSFHPPYGSTVPDMYAKNRDALMLFAELACMEPQHRGEMTAAIGSDPDVMNRLTGGFEEILEGREYSYPAETALSLDGRYHCVISGRLVDEAGNGVKGTIRLQKSFENFLWAFGDGTNPTGRTTQPEIVDCEITTDDDGSFRWVTNPSTRPYVEFSLANPELALVDGGREFFTIFGEVDGQVTDQRSIFLTRGQTRDLGWLQLGGTTTDAAAPASTSFARPRAGRR